MFKPQIQFVSRSSSELQGKMLVSQFPQLEFRASTGLCKLALLMIIGTLTLSAQVPPDEREQAKQKAQAFIEAQRFEEAKKIFQSLADRNHGDLEARNWVARLESWQNHFERAEELYRGIISDAPGNVEARIGLTDVLIWRRNYEDGLAVLAELQAERPSDPGVLLRLGRLHRLQNHRREALDYYHQVLALDPTNEEARKAVETLTEQKSLQFETGYLLEEFDFTGNTQGHFMQLLYRDYYRWAVLGRLQYQNKFDQNNIRPTFGVTYRAGRRTWLRGEISGAPPNDTVIANWDFTAEVIQGLPGGVGLGGSYRFLDFETADVQLLTVIGNWDAKSNLHLYLRYIPARTEFRQSGQSEWSHSGWARLVWDANNTFSPFLVYAVGTESFESLSADRLGRFSAQTYGGGGEIRFAAGQGIRLAYSFQDRTSGSRQQGLSLSYFIDF